MKRSTYFSIGILIAFFLPWVDLLFFSVSGYGIPTSLDKLSTLSGNNSDGFSKISYFLYLIPISALFNIIRTFSGYKRAYYFLNEFIFGSIAVVLVFLIVLDKNILGILSFGYYLTVLFSILGIFSYAKDKREDRYEYNDDHAQEEPSETKLTTTEKTALLNQLSQLHTLKEKGALTEDIYNQEQQEILLKLQKQNADESTPQTEPEEEITPDIEEEYDTDYEETWAKRNKTWIIIAVVVATIGIYFWYNSKSDYEVEVEKWKQELFLKKEVGPPCKEDYNKWVEENPDYYWGMQEIQSKTSDFNGDGIEDKLFYFPAVNCVGGNGSGSDFAMLVYSHNNQLLTDKEVTLNIEAKIRAALSEMRVYNIEGIMINYKSLNKTIDGVYYAIIGNDSSHFPSIKGTFEYNPVDSSIKISKERNEY